MPEPRPTSTPQGDVYEVFAKFQQDEPIYHVGRVIAPDVDLARTYAFTLYQEVTWSDMIIVPRRDVVTIIEVA